MNRIAILTGPIGSGKTSACLALAEHAREAGIDLGGLLSPGVFKGGEKQAIDVLDLKSSRRMRLAELKQVRSSEVETQRWAFQPKAVDWGNQRLLDSVPCDLLLIDELGPLEFFREKGWVNGFRVLEEGQYGAALVVIRPSLLEEASRRWPLADLLDLASAGSPPSPQELAERLLGG